MKLKKIAAVLAAATAAALLCVAGAITVYSEDTDHPNSHDHDDSAWTELEGTNGFTVTLESGNYHLNKDITINRPYEIQKNAVVNICLNGHDITGTGYDGYIRVLTGGELNIYDCQEKCGKVANDDNRPIMTNGNGKITLYNGSIEHNGTALNDYCISLNSGDTLTVKGGNIYAEQSCVHSQSGTVIVEGGKIEGGNGGIYSQNHIEISDGEVIGGSYGVLNDTSKATMTVSGDAKISGGEIGINNKGTLTVTGGTITGSLYGIDISQSASAKTDISSGVIQGGEYGIYTKYATTLSGDAEITGDIADLCIMPASASNMLIINEKLSDETLYSVYMPNPGVFTKSTNTDFNIADNFVPAQEHINNGYEIVKNSNGQLELIFNPHTHDDKTFIPWTSNDSLPTAAGSYCLTTDVEIDLLSGSSYNYWTAPTGEYDLCLNGHTITVNYTIKIGSGSNFNIYDCQDKCGGIVIERNTFAELFYVLSGELTVYNGKLESKYGTAINQANSDSVTTIEGGTVSGMYNGILVNSGTVTVNDGTVEGATDGIGCCGSDAELIVNDGNISGLDGSGLYVTDGTAAVNGGNIEGTDAICCNDVTGNAEIIVKGGTVSGDSTGIWILGGTVKVENGTIISGNDAGIWCNIDFDDPALVNALEVTGGTINSPSYAIFSGDPEITVKLSGNPALNGDTADIYLGKDAKVSIAAALMNTDPYTVEMYQAGVFTDSDTTGNNDPDKFEAAEIHSDEGYAVVKNSDGQLALALKPYTVTYDGGEYGEGTIDAVTVVYGTSVTLSSEKFTRTGYIQIGWATEDGGDKEYDFGDTYSEYTDITLYPAWAECKHSSESPSWNDDKNHKTHSRICEVCRASITENHNFGDWADTEDSENHTRTCADCGAAETDEHTFDDWADCKDGENHTRTCTDCGATETEEHTLGNWADCEDGENHTRTCAGCGATETEEHTLGNWADCEDGENHTRTCAGCGATETEEHTLGDWADCEDGENHIRACGVCKAEETAPHTEDEGEVTKEATDTEDGEITYKCKDCGYVMRTESIPKTGGNTPGPSKPEPSGPEPTRPDPKPSEPKPEPSEPKPTEPEPSDPMPAEPVPDDPDAGNVYVDSNSGENAPDVNIDADSAKQLKEEAIAYHLTDEEKAAVAGGADLDIILSVEDAGDTVSAEDKQAAETVIADTSYILGQYLNIDLLKLINGEQVGKITELNTPISVTIEVPETLRGENRAYAIVRVHEGAAEILEDQDSNPYTITILTDRFSTYAIVYKDKDADDKNQATGAVLLVTPFIAAAAGMIVFKKRKA